MKGYALVGGWPGSGKTTLARSLAAELGTAYLSKDDVKEALMDGLGASVSLEESRRLGRTAVAVVLRVARGCPGAVIDSTWFAASRPLVLALPGPVIEVRCRLDVDLARARYRARTRDPRHLDGLRAVDELWATPVEPLGVGPLVEVDTTGPVDVPAVAALVRGHLTGGATG